MLADFYFSRFLFELKAEEQFSLPTYKGSTFRGAFGHAFKKVVCTLRRADCTDCLLKERCVYSYIFETPLPENNSDLSKYRNAPHPFVILPPLDDRKFFPQGVTIPFVLTLIGRAVEYLPYFIYTFSELGNTGFGSDRGKFTITRVLRLNGTESIPVYEGDGKILKSAYETMSWQNLVDTHSGHNGSNELSVQFISPTRIRQQNDLVVDLDFSVFFRSLLRRIDALSYFHCGCSLNGDVRSLIQQANEIQTKSRRLSWYDWERYSNRQETRMKLGGFIGEVTFTGILEPFMPYILLGEYIHVGKGTSFGLGKYEINREHGRRPSDDLV